MTVYKGWRADRVTSDGVFVSTYSGTVSECGQWVECGETRHRISPQWHARAVDAEAAMAGEIEEIGRRLLEQATKLREAAEVVA
jgi:hypothetical protein